MLESLTQTAQRKAEEVVRTAIYGAFAALSAAVALGLFTAAAYVWAQDAWGAIIALCAVGCFYLLLALAVFLIDRVRRRANAEQQQAEQQQAEPLLSPGVVGAVTEVFRMARARNLIPALALSAVVLAALERRRRDESA